MITPNGPGGTGVMTGRTPARVRAGATALLHPGAVSDLAGTADGNGATAADGIARRGGRPRRAGRMSGRGRAHEASNATAPQMTVTATGRRAVPLVIV